MSAHQMLSKQRGIALIEALVALGVMAFGMLALVGVQSTLRVNADLARERTEATRIAEQQLETARGFTTVGDLPPTATDFDSIHTFAATLAPDVTSGRTTAYNSAVVVTPLADGLQKNIKVTVAWVDRYGQDRAVILRAVVTRAAPVLSGLVSAVKTLTVVGQRKNRHPTIPFDAIDLNNPEQESAFRPPLSGGSLAWVFNNATGVISRVCTIDASNTLTACENTSAQLLSGYVRFNLRGVSLGIDGARSAYKPVPAGLTAYIIENSQVTKQCPVASATAAPAIDFASLMPSCTNLSPAQDISPFNAADPAGYVLDANDSLNPKWPALNLGVSLAHDSSDPVGGHTHPPLCFADAPGSASEASSKTVVPYFCIVYPGPNGPAWAGQSTVTPQAFIGDAAPWTIAAGQGNYKVCRYTTSTTQYAENSDHPQIYSKWVAGCGPAAGIPHCRFVTGNLINQNFLVIDGNKSCPTDVPIDPISGDLVNSNTLQHQP